MAKKKQAVGVDVGYNAVKAVCAGKKTLIPSVTSAPIGSVFGITGLKEVDAIDIDGFGEFSFGSEVIEHANVWTRREDRKWYESNTYIVLLLAAITELFPDNADLMLTTGLPVSFYENDSKALADRIAGKYTVQRTGRDTQQIKIERDNIRVIPQPYGTLFSQAYNKDGDITISGSEIMKERVGIIDVGGRTTNFQVTNEMTQIASQKESIDVGGWKVVQAARTLIKGLCPDLPELPDHTVAQAVRDKSIIYYGDEVDLSEGVDKVLQTLSSAIASKAGTLWEMGADLQTILVTGGGAFLLGDLLKESYPHPKLIMVDDPVYANANGYHRFSLRQLSKK